MKIEKKDYNNFPMNTDPSLVAEIENCLTELPLFVKFSDQKGKKGNLVFSPVATNSYLEGKLHPQGWSKIPVPKDYNALGIDIDFGKKNLLVEAQFSNYPFFANNTLRATILFNAQQPLPPMGKANSAIIITKCKLFESANSTLYYEQAIKQMDLFQQYSPINLPLRIIGLTADRGVDQNASLVTFESERYSRSVSKKEDIICRVGTQESLREIEKIVRID